jgi:hypothetical protein
MPFKDVTGKAARDAPLQTAATAVKVGIIKLVMVTDVVAITPAHPPDAGTVYVTVYVPGVLPEGVIEPVVSFSDNPVGAV